MDNLLPCQRITIQGQVVFTPTCQFTHSCDVCAAKYMPHVQQKQGKD